MHVSSCCAQHSTAQHSTAGIHSVRCACGLAQAQQHMIGADPTPATIGTDHNLIFGVLVVAGLSMGWTMAFCSL